MGGAEVGWFECEFGVVVLWQEVVELEGVGCVGGGMVVDGLAA